MFFSGSRYLKTADLEVTAADGSRMLTKRAREPVATTPAMSYQVRAGDRLDLLAWRFYRDPRKWWLIADANPDHLTPESLMVPGTLLTIPKDRNA